MIYIFNLKRIFLKIIINNIEKNSWRYKNRGNIKWEVAHPNKYEAKSSKDIYDNDIEEGN
jgi:hypothetical protein